MWERIRPLCQIGFGPVRNYLAMYFRVQVQPIWRTGLSRSTYRSHKILKGRQFEPFSPQA